MSVFDTFVIPNRETLSLRINVFVVIAQKLEHQVTPAVEVRIAKDWEFLINSVVVAKYAPLDTPNTSIPRF